MKRARGFLKIDGYFSLYTHISFRVYYINNNRNVYFFFYIVLIKRDFYHHINYNYSTIIRKKERE